MTYVPGRDAEPVVPTARDALGQLRLAAAAAGVDLAEVEAAAADPHAVPTDEEEAARQQMSQAAKRHGGTLSCAACGNTIDGKERGTLREIAAWIVDAESAAKQTPMGRTNTGRYACAECGTRIRAGLPVGQEALL